MLNGIRLKCYKSVGKLQVELLLAISDRGYSTTFQQGLGFPLKPLEVKMSIKLCLCKFNHQ